MKRQMWMLIAVIAVMTQCAEARIGETYGQCSARYGSSYTNFPGLNHLYGVAIFEKDGINVTIAYDQPNKQGFLALYTNGRFLSQNDRRRVGDLKDNEVDSLMGSLNVSWESTTYIPPRSTSPSQSRIDPTMRTFAGPRKVKGGTSLGTSVSTTREDIATSKPRWTENLELAKAAARDFAEAITLEKPRYVQFGTKTQFTYEKLWVGGFIFWPDGVAIEPYRRRGDNLFAFKLLAGGKCLSLILIDSNAAKAIFDWAKAYVKSHDNPPAKDKGRTLKGF